MARGMTGFEAWVTEQASADAAADIPGNDWVDVLPSLVRETQRIGAAELEAIGKTWAQRNQKISSDMCRELTVQARYVDREERLDSELVELKTNLDKYFEEARISDTLDDDYRRFEGPLSAKTIGFWLLLTVLALGELPLTHASYRRLDSSWTTWLAAFATGVGLVGAGHFVGTKARRLVTLKERWKDYEDRTQDALDLAKERAKGEPVELPKVPTFPDRRPPSGMHLMQRFLVVLAIFVLAIVACLALGTLRSQQVTFEMQQRASECPLGAPDPDDAEEYCAELVTLAEKAEGKEADNTRLFSLLQILIFGVAAATTYLRHDEFAEAVRTLRGKIMMTDYLRRRAQKRGLRAQARVEKHGSKRQAEFVSRVLECKERRKAYEATVYRTLTIMNRERPSGPSFEIAALRAPLIYLPSWLIARYPLPGRDATDKWTLSVDNHGPEADIEGPLLSPDIDSQPHRESGQSTQAAPNGPIAPNDTVDSTQEEAAEEPVGPGSEFGGAIEPPTDDETSDETEGNDDK
jgi:hypothetical protein